MELVKRRVLLMYTFTISKQLLLQTVPHKNRRTILNGLIQIDMLLTSLYNLVKRQYIETKVSSVGKPVTPWLNFLEKEVVTFWAHLCQCTVGSYASLSVCHYTKSTRKIHISGTVWLRSKLSWVRVKGHKWSRSNKDSTEGQVGSQQRQIASLYKKSGR